MKLRSDVMTRSSKINGMLRSRPEKQLTKFIRFCKECRQYKPTPYRNGKYCQKCKNMRTENNAKERMELTIGAN